jgi:hypothetical protein
MSQNLITNEAVKEALGDLWNENCHSTSLMIRGEKPGTTLNMLRKMLIEVVMGQPFVQVYGVSKSHATNHLLNKTLQIMQDVGIKSDQPKSNMLTWQGTEIEFLSQFEQPKKILGFRGSVYIDHACFYEPGPHLNHLASIAM